MKNRHMRKQKKILMASAILWTTAVLGAVSPLTAFAANPEFARTPEEWEKLRDNVLEYEEIADLVQEYNVTVQNNQYEYNKFIQDYGRTREDIAKEYRDLADDLESDMSGGDSAMEKIADLQLQLQADQLREQADDNLEDSHIYYLTYCQAEDNLVMSAQSRMISYYSTQLELESAREKRATLQNDYQLLLAQQQAGMATENQVLDAEESILEQEKTIYNLEMKVESTRQKLITMLGWKGTDQPEIGNLPQVDLEEIDAIDLEKDKQEALENNYTLNINKRKLENAREKNNKEDLEKTIISNERQIGVSVTAAYQSLITAKMSYEQALENRVTEERNTELARQRWNAGVITQYAFQEQEYMLSEKQRSVETASMALLEALETYRWNIKGLASAG